MEKKIKKLEHSHVEVLVSVDVETWKAAQKKAFDKEASKIKIDGFRPGKAPEQLVRSRVDQGKVLEEAVNEVLPKAYEEIIKEGINPHAQPKVDVTKISDTDLELKFVIVTEPEVTLGTYKGLKVKKGSAKVSEAEVKKALDDLLKENASLAIKEGESALGDVVVMDFKGRVDDKEFEGGSAENYELELGSNSFIPGFEEQLVGKKAGEHVDVKVKFPENYTPELKGKDAVFGCDIHEVKAKKLPELNDEFVKELSIKDVNTLEELKAHKQKELESAKEKEINDKFMADLIEEILKTSTVDVPEEIIDAQVESRKKDLENRISQSGLTLEQYLSLVGQKEEEFVAQIKKDALKEVSNYFLINKIAEVEKIEVNKADIEAEMKKLAEQYKMKLEDVKKALAQNMGAFADNLKLQKVEKLLKENN